MSCVAYWTYCEDCKHESYSRFGETTCQKCGSREIDNHMEWDEENDHHKKELE